MKTTGTGNIGIMYYRGDFNKMYAPLSTSAQKFDGHTSVTSYSYVGTGTPNGFYSRHNEYTRETVPIWNAAQFHWHAKSEHTVNGRQFDLELHVVHTPETKDTSSTRNANGFIYAVLGIFFDTDPEFAKGFEDHEIRIIDDFLDSMRWGSKQNDNSRVRIGQFLNMVDTRTRWTYKGSLTTPPCSTSV